MLHFVLVSAHIGNPYNLVSTSGKSFLPVLGAEGFPHGSRGFILSMRNRDPHRENVENILAIQHIRECPSASHAMGISAWNDFRQVEGLHC